MVRLIVGKAFGDEEVLTATGEYWFGREQAIALTDEAGKTMASMSRLVGMFRVGADRVELVHGPSPSGGNRVMLFGPPGARESELSTLPYDASVPLSGSGQIVFSPPRGGYRLDYTVEAPDAVQPDDPTPGSAAERTLFDSAADVSDGGIQAALRRTKALGLQMTPRQVDFILPYCVGPLTGDPALVPSRSGVARLWGTTEKAIDGRLLELRRNACDVGLVDRAWAEGRGSTEMVARALVSQGLIVLEDLRWANLDRSNGSSPRRSIEGPRFNPDWGVGW